MRVGKADPVGDLIGAKARLAQVFLGLFHAQIRQVFHERLAGLLLEDRGKIACLLYTSDRGNRPLEGEPLGCVL